MRNENSKHPEQSEEARSHSMLDIAAHNKLWLLFPIAHFIAKQGKPYTDYKPLCEHDTKKDTKVGLTYINDKMCATRTRWQVEHDGKWNGFDFH